MLFQNGEGTVALQIFSRSILFASLAVTATAVLQGRDTQFSCDSGGRRCCSEMGVKHPLVPRYGIEGASLATAASFVAVAGLNLYQLRQKEWLNKLRAVMIPIIGCAL